MTADAGKTKGVAITKSSSHLRSERGQEELHTSCHQHHRRDSDSRHAGHGSRCSPTAGLVVVGDIVHLRGDLKHGAVEVTVVVVIDKKKVRGTVPLGRAVPRHRTKTTIATNRIGLVKHSRVGNKQINGTQIQLNVQVVVGHVHAVLSLRHGDTWWALLSAREFPTGGREGRLPDLGSYNKIVKSSQIRTRTGRTAHQLPPAPSSRQ